MSPYAEANFIVALYLETPFASDAEECMAKARAAHSVALPMTDMLQLEVTNAMQLHVFVTRHGGPLRISWETAAAAFGQFQEDLQDDRLYSAPVVDSEELHHAAAELALRHSAKHGFRTYDILHVASALLLACDTFWSYDKNARKLAALEGLALNPWPAEMG